MVLIMLYCEELREFNSLSLVQKVLRPAAKLDSDNRNARPSEERSSRSKALRLREESLAETFTILCSPECGARS